MLMCLSRHSFQPGAENASGRPLDRFIHCVEIVHKEYDSPLSASVLAERIGFSEPTIYRLFQEHMGVSLTRYLNSVRVSAACGLMENLEGCSMTEIAEQCGFTSLSNFYRTFRQFVGVPPREYRKQRQASAGLRGMQKDLLLQNRCQAFWQLPTSREALRRLGEGQPRPSQRRPCSKPGTLRGKYASGLSAPGKIQSSRRLRSPTTWLTGREKAATTRSCLEPAFSIMACMMFFSSLCLETM